MLTFLKRGRELFFPNSTWMTGRNALLRLALAWEYGQGIVVILYLYLLL